MQLPFETNSNSQKTIFAHPGSLAETNSIVILSIILEDTEGKSGWSSYYEIHQ